MVSKGIILVILASSLALSGCESPPSKEQQGMIIGGVLGGVLGSRVGGGDGRTAAIIIGTLIGASVGGAVGRSMDDTDRLKTAHALETVRTGIPSSWRNPDTGYEYTVVPTRTYETTAGPCREFTIDAVIGARQEEVVGTACRQNDGSWKIQ